MKVEGWVTRFRLQSPISWLQSDLQLELDFSTNDPWPHFDLDFELNDFTLHPSPKNVQKNVIKSKWRISNELNFPEGKLDQRVDVLQQRRKLCAGADRRIHPTAFKRGTSFPRLLPPHTKTTLWSTEGELQWLECGWRITDSNGTNQTLLMDISDYYLKTTWSNDTQSSYHIPAPCQSRGCVWS